MPSATSDAAAPTSSFRLDAGTTLPRDADRATLVGRLW